MVLTHKAVLPELPVTADWTRDGHVTQVQLNHRLLWACGGLWGKKEELGKPGFLSVTAEREAVIPRVSAAVKAGRGLCHNGEATKCPEQAGVRGLNTSAQHHSALKVGEKQHETI